MNNEELINEYREQLLKVHRATISLVSIVEIVAYFVFVVMGVQTLSLKCTYLWLNVVSPICINLLVHLGATFVCRSNFATYRFKNASVIYAAVATSIVVSLFHRDYLVTSCAFVFPIILSALYNERKILQQSFWISLISLTFTVMVLFIERKLDLTVSLNVVVLYGFLAVSFLAGDLSVKFSQRNFTLIEEQAIANSKLEVEIDLDQMTQLYNHAAFYDRLEKVLETAKSEESACCLAMIDIDDFKKVNDTHGHNAGEMVLIALADILKSCCRESGFACRYGGEEFALILCEKTLAESQSIMESVLQCFSKMHFSFTKKSLTFSCGIAKFSQEDTKDTLFNRADQHLYTSKKNGKNQITLDVVA